MPRTVLISGAGIAGTTLAWWLARSGFSTTVVERAGRARSSGAPVDVRGRAMEVVAAMNLTELLRREATRVHEMQFLDPQGRESACVSMADFASGGDGIEIPRGDLARILYEACETEAEYLFSDQIAEMTDTLSGVDVRFESGAERHFDLVIGADGLHSRVRELVFGPEATFVHHAGLYFATMPLPDEKPNPGKLLLWNSPSRAIAIHPAREKALCAFIFRHPQVLDIDLRQLSQQRLFIESAYRNQGWRSAELIENAKVADDLYFDAVSRVMLDRWSRGNVALLGDAASCLSLFGQGSSSAIIGAQILAKELSAARDVSEGFARYEQQHRPLIESHMRNFKQSTSLLVPKTRFGITMRNLAIRLIPAFKRAKTFLRPQREH